MAIRIWHQSFTVLSDLVAYDEALRAHFRRVSLPDTVIDMHGMRAGTYRICGRPERCKSKFGYWR